VPRTIVLSFSVHVFLDDEGKKEEGEDIKTA
jgi:hypothetical protein